MNEQTISKNEILSELSKSPHGKYSDYVPVCARAASQESEFLARLISWNRDNGQIRDSKVALPVVSLSVPAFNTPELVQNSIAHIALLDPRNLVKALRFAREIKTPGHGHQLRRLVEQYLKYREDDWQRRFTPSVVRYKNDMKELYALYRVPRSERVGVALFGGERGQAKVAPVKGTVFEGIARLKEMGVTEAAAFIVGNNIPFLTARGALGERFKEPDILRVLVERMSPTELATNMKMLEKAGAKNLPAVRGAMEAAMGRAAGSNRNVLKTARAIDAVEDESLKEKLRGLQERQVKNIATIEGDWLVLGDKSGSMATCIEVARRVAGTLAKLVKGKVYLVFFDVSPRFFDVSSKSYEDILAMTSMVTAQGGTSIGCGLQYLIDRKIAVNGIAIVSDAQENSAPCFIDRYAAYTKMTDTEPAVYLYRCGDYKGSRSMFTGDRDLRDTMNVAGFGLDEFQLGMSVDYYSIPALAQSMTVQRYGLIDKVLNTPLITLEMVFDGTFRSKKTAYSTDGRTCDKKEKQHV